MTFARLTDLATGYLILLAGAIVLPLLVPGSELLMSIAFLGVLGAIWSFRAKNRWYAGLVGVFLWSLIGLHLRAFETLGAGISLVVVVAAVAGLALWQLETVDTQHAVFGLAAAIVTLEIFLVLLFWPINFPTRALLVTMTYGLVLETIDLQRRGLLSFRSIGPGLGMSAVLTYVLVTTSDWFAF